MQSRNAASAVGNRSRSSDFWGAEGLGKLPPQAIEVEESVLGALLLEKSALTLVADMLKPESFYKEAHQRIYQAIQLLDAQHAPVDILTVCEVLGKQGHLELVGGREAVLNLTIRVNSAANIETHARIILERAMKRQMINLASTVLREAYEDVTDAFDLLERTEKGLLGINNQHVATDVPWDQQLANTIREGVEMAATGKLPGVPSAFGGINTKLGGYQPGNLYLIGARPGMGKSLYMINEAIPMAYEGVAVGIWTLEMIYQQNVKRILSCTTGIEHNLFKFNKVYQDKDLLLQVQNKAAELAKLKFGHFDTPNINLAHIKNKARRLRAEGLLDIVFIDYLQLIQFDAESKKRQNKSENVGEISWGLKDLAKELKIPIVAFSQLSRAVENRDQSLPQLSDLRDSGSLEQDADVVQFLYRPEYYNLDTATDGGSSKGIIEVHTMKNREGQLGVDTLTYRPNASTIIESPFTPPNPSMDKYVNQFPRGAAVDFSEPLNKQNLGDENTEAPF